MRIIGPPSASYNALRQSVSATEDVFQSFIFPALWRVAVIAGIDPVGVVCQSVKETGRGKFGGLVPVGFYNTCGLKWAGNVPGDTIGEVTSAHARFASWDAGAIAHVQHVCAYAGQFLPAQFQYIIDPRYILVSPSLRLENWSQLGTKWAPSPVYGDEIERMMGDVLKGRLL